MYDQRVTTGAGCPCNTVNMSCWTESLPIISGPPDLSCWAERRCPCGFTRGIGAGARNASLRAGFHPYW
ncbi:hypothetical protein GCM10023175_48360 [Pseudonocardia xishanensis]|uniref:Uncharacterized protein n=1 Tax=Pseudonocardia xishanensis TaxID=630995 RepID=A0ABP8RYV0_9PSEU